MRTNTWAEQTNRLYETSKCFPKHLLDDGVKEDTKSVINDSVNDHCPLSEEELYELQVQEWTTMQSFLAQEIY